MPRQAVLSTEAPGQGSFEPDAAELVPPSVRSRTAAHLCETGPVPRMPMSPVTTAYVLYKAWRRLPPQQRRLLLEAARTHGPMVAAMAAQMSKKAVAARRRPSSGPM